jgi:hypothetical protein
MLATRPGANFYKPSLMDVNPGAWQFSKDIQTRNPPLDARIQFADKPSSTEFRPRRNGLRL